MPALVPRMSRSPVRDLRRCAWTGTTTFGVAAAPAVASSHKSAFFLTFYHLFSDNSSSLSSSLPFPTVICPQPRQRNQQKQQPSQALQLDRPRFCSSSPSDAKSSSSSSLIMASATSIYDFKPLDSKQFFPLQGQESRETENINMNLNSRARPTSSHVQLQRKGSPHRQHSLQMRLHSAVCGSRIPLQEAQGKVSRRFCHTGLPLQSVRSPRTWQQ